MRARRIFLERERAEGSSDESEYDFQDADFEDSDILRISAGIPSPCPSPQPETLPTISELGRQWGRFWKKESSTPPCLPIAVIKQNPQEEHNNPQASLNTCCTLEELRHNFVLPISRKMRREIVSNEMRREAIPFLGFEAGLTPTHTSKIIPVNDEHFPEAGNFQFVYYRGGLQLVGARFSPDLTGYIMM